MPASNLDIFQLLQYLYRRKYTRLCIIFIFNLDYPGILTLCSQSLHPGASHRRDRRPEIRWCRAVSPHWPSICKNRRWTIN